MKYVALRFLFVCLSVSLFVEFLSEDHFLLTDLDAGRLYQVDMNTGKVSFLLNPGKYTSTVAVSPDQSVVYWSDTRQKEIRSSYLNGTNMKTVFSTGEWRAFPQYFFY